MPRREKPVDVREIARLLAIGTKAAQVARDLDVTNSLVNRRVVAFRRQLAALEVDPARKVFWLEEATVVQVASAWLEIPEA